MDWIAGWMGTCWAPLRASPLPTDVLPAATSRLSSALPEIADPSCKRTSAERSRSVPDMMADRVRRPCQTWRRECFVLFQ
eukprot:1464994-Rhodomonas_salina.4